MLLDGKRILVTGVLNDASIAFGVAKYAQEQGAEVILSSFGRVMSITERVAKRLPELPRVVELDVQSEEHITGLKDVVGGTLDGALHAIAFAPESCLGGGFLEAPWEDVSTAMHVSTYSLAALSRAVLPLMEEHGGSIVGLDFDNSTQAWPLYDWMGVSKAALAATSRYLARDLGPKGVRVNLIAAGPLRTLAAKSIPGFEHFEDVWVERAPLGWDLKNTEPVAKAAAALFSDLFPATTGEVIHVDGGVHAVGA